MALNVQQYNAEQVEMHRRQHELLCRMTDQPFNMRHVDLDAEAALQGVEEWVLDNPPLYEVMNADGTGSGNFQQRSHGLVYNVANLRSGLRTSSLVRNFPRADFKTIPINQWDDYLQGPDAVDLRPFVPFIMDQNGVGSCAAEAAAQCIQICRATGRQKPVKLSPWFAYHTVSGGRDGGSSLPENVNFALQYGIPSQDAYPRSEGWRSKPPAAAYSDAEKYKALEVFRIHTWEEFCSCLLYAMPVYFGYSGHAITGVTLLSTTRVQYANSWGNWGDAGFGTISEKSIYWGYGVFGFRAVVRTSNTEGRSS